MWYNASSTRHAMEIPTKRRPTLRAEYRFRSRLGSPYTGVHATGQEFSLSSRFNTTSLNVHHQLHGTTKEESDGERVRGCRLCPLHFLVENKWVRRFFRVCAVLNLLSLMFSASFYTCLRDDSEDCDKVFVQYATITSIDFVLALIYTVQTLARLNYAIYIRTRKVSSRGNFN